ncbi:putative tetratricopeptide-like helical domain-containing protein [Medicago truncatula]|uniref:Putative tetratricopeptide-like helical domain-containing protein n=1 Tax=Medicago truncatula TaxID=3880 RepID=A0A396IXY6_MEDTR|nr:putative tetratricopeptide-like helical domain-containing protein [Medicago truncatula]
MRMELHGVCRTLCEARQLQLFDEMPQPNPFSWNTLIEAHINLSHRKKSLELFHAMPHKSHYSWNQLVSTFSKSGDLQQAHNLFNAMPMKNPLVWNSMIHGYSRHGYPRKAILLFKEMIFDPLETMHRDAFVLSTVFGACADLFVLDCGKQVHARVFIDGFEFKHDKVLCSSIVNLYGKCGDLDIAVWVVGFVMDVDDFSLSALVSGYANAGRMSDARRVFDNKVDPCSVLWNSIISGYVSNGEEMEALDLFNQMRRSGVRGEFPAVANILSAASSLLNFELVKQMHDHAFKIGATHDIVVASTLLDAYSKCQHSHEACELFDELKVYDAILLNTMITVYCNCGRIEDAKGIFQTMPNKTLISWNSILVGLTQNACPS